MPSPSEVFKLYKAAKEIVKPYKRNWLLNACFFMNEQWVAYDPYTQRLRTIIQDSRKPRPSSNIIRPRTRREYGTILAQQLVYNVQSTPVTPDSIQRCKAAKAYLDQVYKTYDFQRQIRDAVFYMQLYGYGGLQWIYDHDAGPKYDLAGESVSGGDPMIDACSPFEMLFDPHARFMDECSWVIREKLRSKEYIREKYGKDVSVNTNYDMMSTTVSKLRMQNVQNRLPSAPVSVFWMRSTARYPSGYYLVFSGENVLYEGDHPNAGIPGGEIPFEFARHTPIPGEIIGDSSVTDMRQINVIYNRLRCDILESSVKLANPPLIAPQGSLMKDPGWYPGEVVYTNPIVQQGNPIQQVQIQPYPPSLPNMLVRLEQEADELAGIIRQQPRGVRSGDQMAQFNQAMDEARQPQRDEYRNMIEKALNGVLQLARANCDLPRFITITGEDEGSYLFKGEDIPDNARVSVSVRPKKSAQEVQQDVNFVVALTDRGIAQDPRYLVKAQNQTLDFNEITVDLELDEKHALRENEQMKQGVLVPVESWHNHVIHRLEHNRARKTPEYEQLPKKVKQVFEQHDQMHQQFLAQAQQPGDETKPRGHPSQPAVEPSARPRADVVLAGRRL